MRSRFLYTITRTNGKDGGMLEKGCMDDSGYLFADLPCRLQWEFGYSSVNECSF